MKSTLKFLMVAFLATSMVFTSCKKKNEEEPKTVNMVGTWELDEAQFNGRTLQKAALKLSIGLYGQIDFTDDKNCAVKIVKDSTQIDPGTFKIEKQGTYKVEDNNVSLTLSETVEMLGGKDILLKKEDNILNGTMKINLGTPIDVAVKFKKQ